MKAELTLPQELVEQIADRVIEKIKPILSSGNGKEDRYLNVKQLSDYTGMSTQWIYNNIKHLPHINLNRKPLFKKSDIDHWLEQFRVKPQGKEIDLLKARAFKQQRAVTSV